MKVISLRHDAVFVNAGSYAIRPKSSSSTLIPRSSIALIVPSVISSSYCSPVRLSVTEREPFLSAVATAPSPSRACVCSSAIAALLDQCSPRLLRTRFAGSTELPSSGRLRKGGLAPVRGDRAALRDAHARRRSRQRIGVRTAARRARPARRTRVEWLAVVRNARRLGIHGVGRLRGPPDQVEQRDDGDLQDHHHPYVEIPSHEWVDGTRKTGVGTSLF